VIRPDHSILMGAWRYGRLLGRRFDPGLGGPKEPTETSPLPLTGCPLKTRADLFVSPIATTSGPNRLGLGLILRIGPVGNCHGNRYSRL